MNAAVYTIVGYLTLVTLIGVLLSRRNKSSSDWATASGGMGLIMIAAGIAGTRIGGAGSYGVAGDVMKTGVWNVWYGVNTFLALALVGIFFAIPYRRLGLTTISQLFTLRYGKSRSGWLTSLCVQTEYLVVNVIEPLLIGVIISNIVGIELVYGIFIGCFVIVASTASSGLKGASSVNIIHCFVIIFGLSLVGYVGASQMGGWDSVVEKANAALDTAGVDQASWWSFVGLGWFPIIAMFFSATIHTPAASVYVNYSSSAKRENIIVPAFLLAGSIAALMPFLSAIVGIEALAKYGANAGIGSYNSITKIAMDTGPLVGGIAIAAVLAALISSGGPILLASSTMFVNDWIPSSKDYSVTKKLKAYRVTAVIYGIIAAIIACYFGYVVGTASVLEWLLLGYAMVVPPAIAIAYIFYVKLTREPAVYWGIASGYALGLIAWILNNLVFHLESDIAAYFTTLVPLIVIPNISLFMLKSTNPQLAQLKSKLAIGLIVFVALGIAISFNQQSSVNQSIVFVISIAAPFIISLIYSFLAKGTTNKGFFWGIVVTYAIAATCWIVDSLYIQSGADILIYITVGLPIVVIPTAGLATQPVQKLDELGEEFYRILKTPS
ncbi:MAG: sodium:solute symporter family protein [Cellvibrionaceae bacterium]